MPWSSSPLKRAPAACLSLAAVALLSNACAPRDTGPGAPSDPTPGYISTPMVERAVDDGARTALDLLRYHPHPGVRLEGGSGTLRHGRSSPYGPSGARLLLVVDGTASADLGWLGELDSRSVRDLRLLAPSEAVMRYGERGSAGAIVVRTLRR